MDRMTRPKGKEECFVHARNGDHLMVTFQCELCHFRNIMKRDPAPGVSRHEELMMSFRRINLDAFWSREPGTVRGNLAEARRTEREADYYGFDSMTEPMGPFPLKDVCGAKAALAVLGRSRDKGKYEAEVQPDTYRQAQSCITNINRAGVSGLGDQIGAHGKHKTWVSGGSTHTLWFSRFSAGIKKRTGKITKQDKSITIDVMHAAMNILETRWSRAETSDQKYRISRMGLWYSGGFCTAMRGEEHLIQEVAAFRNSLAHLTPGRHKIPYFNFGFNGRTKTNRDAGATFKIPCAGSTKTGLKPGVWALRYGRCLERKGVTGGYLFSTRQGGKSYLSDFEEEFYEILEMVQEKHPELIAPDVDVREEYGIWRSLRRGVTAHAINQRVSKDLIHLISRWRIEKDRQQSSASMIDIYTELEDLIPTIIRYSFSL